MKPAERALAIEAQRRAQSAHAALSGVTRAKASLSQLRKLYRVAKTWHARPDTEIRIDTSDGAKGAWRDCAPVFLVGRDIELGVWCRAYVRAWLAARPVIESSADSRAHVVRTGRSTMCAVVDGVFNPPMTNRYVVCASASPYVANDIVRCALGQFIVQLVEEIKPSDGGVMWTVNPALYGTMRRLFTGLAIGAMKRILAEVRPASLAAVRRAGMPRALHWLQCGSRERERRLVDALNAYPVPTLWLMHRLEAWRSKYGMLKSTKLKAEEACERAIADGGSVVDAFAAMFGTTPGPVRLWFGITRQRACPSGIMHAWPHSYVFPTALRLLAALPVHLRPRKRVDYQALFELTEENIIETALEKDPSAVTRWFGPLKTLHDPMIDQGRGLGDVVGNLVDSLKDAVDAGVAVDERIVTDVLPAIFGKRWRSLCALNGRWHAAQVEASTRSAAAGGVKWPGMLRSPFVHEGIEIVELTTGAALRKEGIAMSHCVSMYQGYCLQGQSRVLSIRRNGVRLSTVELKRVDSPRGFVVAQHYRESNLPAPSEATGALNAWLGAVDHRLRTHGADALINLDWPRLPVPRASIDMRWFWAQEPALPASLRRVFAAAL